MKNKLMIFLSGGITGLPEEEAKQWREHVYDELKYSATVFDPAIKFDNDDDTTYEVREYDLYWLKRSDLVIVNFNAPKSIGTAQELAIAKEHGIPVIGILDISKWDDMHPWLIDCCNKVISWDSRGEEKEDDGVDEAVDYVRAYYL